MPQQQQQQQTQQQQQQSGVNYRAATKVAANNIPFAMNIGDSKCFQLFNGAIRSEISLEVITLCRKYPLITFFLFFFIRP